jgi:hypothetical protein
VQETKPNTQSSKLKTMATTGLFTDTSDSHMITAPYGKVVSHPVAFASFTNFDTITHVHHSLNHDLLSDL